MSKYTAGPWSADFSKDLNTITIDTGMFNIGHLRYTSYRDKEEAEANAALIVQAPMMLAMLELVSGVLKDERTHCGLRQDELDKMDEIILLAGGELR